MMNGWFWWNYLDLSEIGRAPVDVDYENILIFFKDFVSDLRWLTDFLHRESRS